MIKKIKECIIAAVNFFSPYNARTPYYDASRHIFVFKGSYRQIGSQYATAVPMENNLCKVRKYLKLLDNDAKQRLCIEVDKAKHFLQERFPEMLEMMKGVSDLWPRYGLNDILLLNYCTTLTDWKLFSSCSSIAFLSNGKPIVGQNLDLGRRSGYAAAYIIPENGNALLAHVNPGFLWFTTGVNEHGLCIAGSSTNVEAQDDINGDYFPQEMLDFFILSRARDTDDAYRHLRNLPPQGPLRCGTNVIFADKNGLVKNIELTDGTISLNEANDPVWITTNHFRTAQLSRLNRRSDKISIELQENSHARYQKALEWASQGSLNTDSLRAFLRRKGYSGAWWRSALPPDAGYTAASYIIDFDSGNFEYWVESEKKYYSVSLGDLRGRASF